MAGLLRKRKGKVVAQSSNEVPRFKTLFHEAHYKSKLSIGKVLPELIIQVDESILDPCGFQICNTPKPINQVANMFDQFRSATDRRKSTTTKSEHLTRIRTFSILRSGRLGILEKLDVRPPSRILRQPFKLEPVPEKSGYGELTRLVIIANPTDPELALDNHRSYFHRGPFFPVPIVGSRDAGRRPPAAIVSRDVSSCPTWKQEPHRHLLLPMVRCCHKPSR
ncbi:hypothetical protein PIB30_045904 [Stylosanthes scabra]|uniref:Uncharacterized protein n=1 Tax=Stylosanthes scabra TaxID=79078 RepID=A0ABU6VI78_9FABA|nr:hypothetical protein [Stylosanthes scabra]